MMRRSSRLFLATCSVCLVARASAVYAPIPEQEQGKLFTIYATAGAYYDSNIFGAPANERSSLVYQISPRLVANVSATDQTLASAWYQLSLDHFTDRPGRRTLASHLAGATVRHTFSPRLQAELSDTYQDSKNPESLLPGLSTVLNTDQSYALNQLEGRLAAELTRRIGLTGKFRVASFSYDNPDLSAELDRDEYLAGLMATRLTTRELQVVAEYRHQAIRYRTAGAEKDKGSHFFLAGADRILNAKSALSARLGAEHRSRAGARDEWLPYVEVAAKSDYAQGAYWSIGYGFSVEEVSNLDTYTDMAVHRFFANWQHTLAPKLTASASASWEPSKLNGRENIAPDRDETNTRLGVALTYRIGVRWAASVTWDRDDVRSDDAGRRLERTRAGVSVRAYY
jgi:Uncharacterized protein conserved in bacteria (DUF2320).